MRKSSRMDRVKGVDVKKAHILGISSRGRESFRDEAEKRPSHMTTGENKSPIQSTLVGAMPSQPQKDRNEARVTTSFGSEFSSLHTNLTRYNDNRDITIQISRKRHIAPTSVDCRAIQGPLCAPANQAALLRSDDRGWKIAPEAEGSTPIV